jgi:hypothetical protein
MSCECAQCRQHYRTLGIAFGIPEESAIEDAYREGVKQWHPDLYENYASLRADAEEHFKQIQVAYRELKEHNTVSAAEVQVESVAIQPQKEETPVISFGAAPGCLVAKQFTPQIEEMIAPHLGKLGLAQAIIDISGNRSRPANYSHFFLLATRGIMMRDARNIISVLWYADLGEINLIDRNKGGKPSSWQKFMGGLSGSQPGYELQINRSNGVNFCAISSQVDDSVKTAIYDFLMNQKLQPKP